DRCTDCATSRSLYLLPHPIATGTLRNIRSPQQRALADRAMDVSEGAIACNHECKTLCGAS
ncbi:MAG: hypothetical protein HC769_04810, partial [Cyanobacteria bacterium CRU_2_1]|nr:hypothetical protein [Cyanobacteria bacterium CRU_2_1]